MCAMPTNQDTALDLQGFLDPRTKEFQDAVRLTPATLAHYRTKGKWIPAAHLLYVASEIAHAIAQGDARIIVELPPRHGKSELISVHTPIWFLDRWPHLNVILATYGATLSEGFGRRVRDTFIEDNGSFLRAQVKEDVQRTDRWMTTMGGGMLSVGLGGTIIGFGAHLFIVDDYVKNFAEAMSEQIAISTWNGFLTDVYTRLEPGASVIVFATRWPTPGGDLIGRILEKQGKLWRRIRLPALAEENDVLMRPLGEALWPGRYTTKRLLSIKGLLDSWLFDSLYQQSPRSEEGLTADVEQIRIVDALIRPQQYRWVRSWDIASTDRRKRKKSDYSVGALLGTEGRPGSPFVTTYVADVVRGQWSPNKLEETIRQTAVSDGAGVPITIEQEPGASGKAYAEHLATNILSGFNVTIQPSAGQNKVVRAQPYIAAVNHGRISYVKATWNKACKDELKEFPGAAHDDTVDACSQGYNFLFQKLLLSPSWGRDLGTETSKLISRPQNKLLVTGATFGR